MATGDNLLEAVTADTIAHETARAAKHSLPIGAPCPNCHTALAGPWCYACGQRGEQYHRSIWRLVMEAIEGLTDLDGRIWKTFPRLIFRPGKLTREYLDGHRAAQVPPFRIFLIVLLAVFFTGGLNIDKNHQNIRFATLDNPELQKELAPKDRADLQQATQAMKAKFGTPKASDSPGEKWLRAQLVKAFGNQQAYKAALAEWAQRFAILMLPIAALMLGVLFLFKKNTYVFDHLIFSMHSLSFQGLLVSLMFTAGLWLDGTGNLLWLSPVHLFVHMRGTYKISWWGTLIRMFLLFIGSSIAFAFLMVGLLLVGLATV
ncbi:MAG: DUF3667 domain-containing protein [Phenylobacterium sp.]